jgi:hypothetical protein
MVVLSALSVGLGILLVVATLSDVFQSVIVPRAVGRRYRLSYYLLHYSWDIWPKLAWRLHPRNEENREDFLAAYAPSTLVVMIAMWGVFLALGYGAIFWGLRTQLSPQIHSYWAGVYFAASSILTVGYGDIVPRGGWARFIAMCAGASGLGVVSITTAFLFSMFAAFQQREAYVVNLGSRAGSPPSGVGLLAICAYAELMDDLPTIMREAQVWSATLMETHLAYPMLAYFRSSHDYESWIGTLGTVLDAATLMMTTIDIPCGQARIVYNLGRHAAHDLANHFYVDASAIAPGVEREEFEHACDRLAAAGFTLKNRDEAWHRFAALRADYAPHLNALARRFDIPPLQWVGDRSVIVPPHVASHPTAQSPLS